MDVCVWMYKKAWFHWRWLTSSEFKQNETIDKLDNRSSREQARLSRTRYYWRHVFKTRFSNFMTWIHAVTVAASIWFDLRFTASSMCLIEEPVYVRLHFSKSCVIEMKESKYGMQKQNECKEREREETGKHSARHQLYCIVWSWLHRYCNVVTACGWQGAYTTIFALTSAALTYL
jgi:hypothetical protein